MSMLQCDKCGAEISKKGFVKLVSRDNVLVSSDEVVAELRSFSPYFECHNRQCKGVLHEQ